MPEEDGALLLVTDGDDDDGDDETPLLVALHVWGKDATSSTDRSAHYASSIPWHTIEKHGSHGKIKVMPPDAVRYQYRERLPIKQGYPISVVGLRYPPV